MRKGESKETRKLAKIGEYKVKRMSIIERVVMTAMLVGMTERSIDNFSFKGLR